MTNDCAIPAIPHPAVACRDYHSLMSEDARARGYTRAAITVEAASQNPRLSLDDARNMVAAAVNAYCPQY